MRMFGKIVFILMFLLGVQVSPIMARECTQLEKDKAEYFAEQAAKKIVDKVGGGQDIRAEVTSCEFNSYSRKFKIGVNIYWNGILFRSNHYELDGILTVNDDGSNPQFSRTWANQQFKDMESLKRWAAIGIGGIILLEALSESGNDSGKNGTE
jgi:hypothetical protein